MKKKNFEKNNSNSTQENAVTQVGDSNYGELERSKHSQVANAGSPHNFVTRNRLIGPILPEQLADGSAATTRLKRSPIFFFPVIFVGRYFHRQDSKNAFALAASDTFPNFSDKLAL